MGRRILMLAYYFPPCGASGTFRSLGFARNLVQMGWDVAVLSASEYLQENRDLALLAKVPASLQLRNAPVYDPSSLLGKIKLPRLARSIDGKCAESPTLKPVQFRASVSLKDQISGMFKTPDSAIWWFIPALKEAASMPKPNLIYSTAPPFSSHLVGCYLKRRWQVPLVTDFRDPWTGNPFRFRREGMVDRWDNFLENLVFRSSDLIIANTQKMEEDFNQKYPQYSSKIRVISNGFDPEDFLSIKRQREEPENQLLLIHPGSLYGQRNPLNFLRALKKVTDEGCIRFRVQFIGSCDYFEGKSLSEHVRVLGLDRYVLLRPPMTHQEVLSMMKGADGLLLFSQGTDMQVPAKLFEYMALEKTIIAVCEEDSATSAILKQLSGRHFSGRNEVHEIASVLTCFHSNSGEVTGNVEVGNSKFERGFLTRKLSGYMEELLSAQVG